MSEELTSRKLSFEIIGNKLQTILSETDGDGKMETLGKLLEGMPVNELIDKVQTRHRQPGHVIGDLGSETASKKRDRRHQPNDPQPKRLIARDDCLENHVLSNLKINQNQDMAAFSVQKATLYENHYQNELWLLHLDDRSIKKLETEKTVNDFIWIDNSLIYFATSGATSIFYKHDPQAKRGKALFSIPMEISEFIFTRNALYFCSRTTDIKQTEHVLEGTETPFFRESMGVCSNIKQSLFCYSWADRSVSRITDENISVNNIACDETERKLVFTSSVYDKYIATKADILLMDIETGCITKISADNPLCISDIGFFDCDTVVFTGSELKEYGKNQNHEIYLLDIHSKQQRLLINGFDKSKTSIAVSTDSRFNESNRFHLHQHHLYFLTVEDCSSYLYQMDKSGTVRKLSAGSGTIDSFAIMDCGILLIGMREQLLQEVYLLRDRKEEKLTGFNDWLINTRIVSKPEALHCTNREGIAIDGWVIKPVDYDATARYPGVLFIHGGPKMVYGDVYNHLMQWLAACGYFVFYCNPRGSDGKGNKFADIRGNFASYAFADITCFLDKVLDTFNAVDPNRLGVIGGSYGGYMVNYMIGRTRRFQAAISERGICNLISNFNTSDIGFGYLTSYLGNKTPWNNVEAYISNSPLIRAQQVKTPTLFIHGKEDHRCHYSESLQMYSAISYFGTEAKLCLFETEHHCLESKGKPLNKIKRLNEILSWFDHHLTNRDQSNSQP